MTTQAEQQKLNRASAAMMEKMSAFVDKQLAEDEERRDLEKSYQSRMVKNQEAQDE
jgi:hypothetical protein